MLTRALVLPGTSTDIFRPSAVFSQDAATSPGRMRMLALAHFRLPSTCGRISIALQPGAPGLIPTMPLMRNRPM